MSPTRRKKIFLTGATGNWGREILRELGRRADRFDVVALVLPSAAELERLEHLGPMPTLTVVQGDLTDYAAVESCVRGADFILHVGAVVSPLADAEPELAYRVNVGSVTNIIRAVQAQPSPEAIGVVMIGSVAETGDRNPPHHWGRVGDPLRVSHYDEYGQSKIIGERALVDSGLSRWVWLRQTAIFHPGLLGIRDPIMTHMPFAGVMEWVSAEDASRLVANLCEDGVPEELWGGVYNVGGGDAWRLTNWEFQTRLLGAIGVRDVRRWYELNWFATKNFHGQWYTDSDRLEALVPFRRDCFDLALERAVRQAPAAVRLAGRVPAWMVKRFVMTPLTREPRGTMAWLRQGDEARVCASFGSREQWAQIGDWSTFVAPCADRTPRVLQHGYDEAKPRSAWALQDMSDAATFRGGTVRSAQMKTGDLRTPLQWRCALGHEFSGSPRLILSAGHWCPTCVRDCAGYRHQAETNRFLAQLEPG